MIDEYGDVRYLNGMVLTDETLATVAGRDLDEIRSLAVGQPAPEIVGLDGDGKPMALSESRGRWSSSTSARMNIAEAAGSSTRSSVP